MLIRLMFVIALCVGVCATRADIGDGFFAKVQKKALADLERGKPARQLEAAGQLGDVEFAPQVAAALARLLTNPDPVIRLGAAEKLWEYAARDAEAYAAAQPALRAALDDSDAAVAMNAAGALQTMDVPPRDLAAARRRVLGSGVHGYVAFLAARGLIGIDPAPPLLPHVLEYYIDAIEAEARGGSEDNVEIAEKALASLANTQDRALITPLLAALDASPPATPFLLKQLRGFKPKPEGWTARLLRHADSPYPDVRDSAWDLLGDELDAESLNQWAPLAAKALAQRDRREDALGALADAAGRTPHGLPEIAVLAGDGSADEALRTRAIEVLADAADTSDNAGTAAVHAAARGHWEKICEPMLKRRPIDAYFKACRSNSHYIIADDRERARRLGEWLSANPNADAKVEFLQSIEGLWDKGVTAIDATRAAMASSDARVAAAAEAAMNRIRPAWREADARAARAPAAATTSAPTSTVAVEKVRGADGAGLFEAISKGQLARVKQLVKASNANVPVNYPQVEGVTPAPLQIAINYCGIPQAEAGLKAIIEYLLSVGANPDVNGNDGSNLLDRAKYSCSPEVMAVLGR